MACPVAVVAECTSPAGAAVSFSATASDVCDPVTVSCSIDNGSTVAFGEHTDVCGASDGNGNASSCSFPVQVVDTTAPHIVCPRP